MIVDVYKSIGRVPVYVQHSGQKGKINIRWRCDWIRDHNTKYTTITIAQLGYSITIFVVLYDDKLKTNNSMKTGVTSIRWTNTWFKRKPDNGNIKVMVIIKRYLKVHFHKLISIHTLRNLLDIENTEMRPEQ